MASVCAGTQQAPERAIVKVALASLAGSSIEWYCFAVLPTASTHPATLKPSICSVPC